MIYYKFRHFLPNVILRKRHPCRMKFFEFKIFKNNVLIFYLNHALRAIDIIFLLVAGFARRSNIILPQFSLF